MAWYSIIPEAYAVNKNIDVSMFSVRSSGASDTSAFIYIGIGLAVFIVLIFVYRWANLARIKRSNKRYLQKRAKAQQQEIELSEDASYRLVALAKAAKANPEKMLGSNLAFEKAVEKLKRNSPTDPMLMKIPALREDLGYIFFNRRAQFVCTQMLQTGQKLRVGVKFKGKSHSYVGTILNTTEDEFWVKPPTVKGKVVNLSKFKTFEFSIFRKNDGEYRFPSQLKAQITTPMNALVMKHVNKIKKLHIREHERYKLQFKRKFYFLTSGRKPTMVSDPSAHEFCAGTVLDISIGGMKFVTDSLPEKVSEGIYVVFKLEEAKIKNEIHAEIVKLSGDTSQAYVHLQFQNLSELNRLYLQKFIASKNPIKV
ncbi:MAG: PilZ domain-containing protein [Proteobacteria bacterium]|nr:PilZ domain-containing protein [Pseudomonadota bacterium]